MSVFKRKTSRGISKFYNYRFKLNGEIFYGTCYLENSDGEKTKCTTKEEALRAEKREKDFALALRKHKTEKGLLEEYRERLTGAHSITLNDAFDLAMQKPRKKKMSTKQFESKKSYWRDFTAFLANNYSQIENLNDVKKRHAEEYISYLQVNGRFDKKVIFKGKGNKTSEYERKHNLSARTIREFYITLKEVFTLLGDESGIVKNPFEGIAIEKRDSLSREAFTPEELTLIAQKADEFIYHIFMVGANTALREGDICTLKWSEVDLDKNFITRKTRKTGTTVEIPILPDLRKHLLKLNKQKGNSDYVSQIHTDIYNKNPSGIGWRVKKFLESIDIQTTKKVEGRSREVSVKDVHSLRHTFCYLAGLQNIPISIVQSIAGHMDAEMTKHYQMHADTETKKKEIGKLSGFMIPERISDTEKAIGETETTTSKQRISEVVKVLNKKKNLNKTEKEIMQILKQ